MIRRTFMALLCLIAAVGIAWAQDGTTGSGAAKVVRPAAEQTVTISKTEFDALKATVAQMRKELDELKGKQIQPNEPAPTAASSPTVNSSRVETKPESDDASFSSDEETPMNAEKSAPTAKDGQQTPPAVEKESAPAVTEAGPMPSEEKTAPEQQPANVEETPSETTEEPAETEEQSAPVAPSGGGKSLTLPDISLIGQAKGYTSTDKHDDAKNSLRLSELELGIQGYVYPNVKADAFISGSPKENSPFKVEEAYLTYLGLSKGLNLYVGQKHVPFGRTNLVHNHSWLYVNQPRVLSNLVAEENLIGEGLNLSYLIPTKTDLFAQLDLGTWNAQGQDAQAAGNLPGVVSGSGAAFSNRFNTARLWTSYPICENSELELGGSYAKGGAQGQAIPGYGQATLTGVDLSYRHFGEGNQRLLLRGESIWRHEEAGSDKNTVSGYYLLGDYRWDKYHSLGLLYDWSQFPQLAAQGDHESALSLIFTRQFSEQYYIRLQATHGYRPDDHSFNELWLQWVWGVGPHTHNLE